MAQSLAKVLIHLIYSTKHRAPLLPQTPHTELHAYAQGILKSQKCHLIEMNNISDHVHILFDLHRTEALSNVVMHLKKGSSRWLKAQSPDFANFDWQEVTAPFLSAARNATNSSPTFATNSSTTRAFRFRMSFGGFSTFTRSSTMSAMCGIRSLGLGP